MNRDIAEKWIADLRTNPPQATGKLFDGNGHCCLGRLCVLYGAVPDEDDDYSFLGNEFVLPTKVKDWAGMKYDDGSYPGGTLTEDNDSGKTFAEIADIIEAHINDL